MSNIKSNFTIKDLENISGVSAHSIRIWERRFGLFTPQRNDQNIRRYDLPDLQYLLNIVLLKKQGHKISQIAELSSSEILSLTRNIVNEEFKKEKLLVDLKMAMYKFDSILFEQLYQTALIDSCFSKIVEEIFFPFLHFIGLFWQTKTITIAHEHFITNLIYQKIQLNIAAIAPIKPSLSKPTIVLYLPEEEMHEISLLYLYYKLLKKGYQVIYLGRSVPLKDLTHLKDVFPLIYWITVFTILPPTKKLNNYFLEVKNFLVTSRHQFWAIGNNLTTLFKEQSPPNVRFFSSPKDILEIL